jgi:2-polyprenyl-3-methyl-5-hydroxy-6-metoxy-1,4-benzoquinol methylase
MSQPVDLDAVRRMSLTVWGHKQGEMVSLMLHLGTRLDLFAALDGPGPVTADELAARTGLHPRWLLEWLRALAAGGILDHHPADAGGAGEPERYGLGTEAAMVLARPGMPMYAAGAFAHLREPAVVDALVDAFRSGVGLTYDQQGRDCAHTVEAELGPMTRALLVPVVVPALDGVAEKLAAGARVADVGCGGGLAIQLLADAFPASVFHGFDPSEQAIELAGEKLGGRPNVALYNVGGEDLPDDAGYDLVLTFDCIHDMPHPDRTIRSIRRAVAADGTWLVKDIRSAPRFEDNLHNPMLAMMYATSVATCLASAMSAPGAMGLGTLGFNPEVAERMAAEAGFGRFRQLPIDLDPANLYYEIRP